MTVVGYGALWLQTVAFATPTDLGGMTIAQQRTSFEAGQRAAHGAGDLDIGLDRGARPAGDLVGGHAARRPQRRPGHPAAADADPASTGRSRAATPAAGWIGWAIAAAGRTADESLTTRA